MPRGAYVVIDLGKTLGKVSLWSRAGEMLDRQVRPNAPVVIDGLKRLDADGIGEWLVTALARYADHPVEAIIPVGHGAGVVAVSGAGPVVAPLDYEQALPADVLREYRQLRDPFALTGSPALPDGLNLGAQLYWLDRLNSTAMARATLLPWAQYWAWFLSDRAVSEVTSLGCHSDLWHPAKGQFSALARTQGWAARFAPLAQAADVAGLLRPDLAQRTGLSAQVKILAGLHDSNAALLAARGFAGIARNEATVLSTGTWFIAMRLPGTAADTGGLPEARDCLVNVDVFGNAVPSARFMGGREIESVIEIDTRRVDIKPDQPRLLAAVPDLLANSTMLLPGLAPGCGPYPDWTARWIAEPADWYARRAAMCLYAALVADVSLDLIGSRERLLIEGRFADAEVFVRALAALRPETAVFVANAHNDVSYGALRLIDPDLQPRGELVQVRPLAGDLAQYRRAWRAALEDRAQP
ncbi:MAG: carbohydrate kinase [Proteobacteria bacterium]|nr:carbohydrate kinase [Pseudomonadota bacterium]